MDATCCMCPAWRLHSGAGVRACCARCCTRMNSPSSPSGRARLSPLFCTSPRGTSFGQPHLLFNQQLHEIEVFGCRWAAKEAAFKAFGRGRGEVLFTEMKVANEPTGTSASRGSTSCLLRSAYVRHAVGAHSHRRRAQGDRFLCSRARQGSWLENLASHERTWPSPMSIPTR